MHVITAKGFALIAKEQAGLAEPNVSRVVAGAGYVEADTQDQLQQLLEQLEEVMEPIADMEVGARELVDGKIVRLPVQLSNLNLTETALIRQIGVYSMTPDGDELRQVVQYEQPVPLPSYLSNSGGVILFSPELDVLFANGEFASTPITPGFLVTEPRLEEHNEDPNAHGGLLGSPSYHIATIRHDLGRYPKNCEVYHSRYTLGTAELGDGPLGGETSVQIPSAVELIEYHSIGIIVPPKYAFEGDMEIHKMSDYEYSLSFDGIPDTLHITFN